MKVYVIVKCCNPESWEVVKVLTTIEKANEYVENNNCNNLPHDYALFIEEALIE